MQALPKPKREKIYTTLFFLAGSGIFIAVTDKIHNIFTILFWLNV